MLVRSPSLLSGFGGDNVLETLTIVVVVVASPSVFSTVPPPRHNNFKTSSDTVSLAAFLAPNELLRRIPIPLIVAPIDAMNTKTHDFHDDVFLDLDDHAAHRCR